MNAAIKTRVLSELAALERKHHVTLLYSCEAGSRAWGFPDAASDYDVRFIYVRPRKWYGRQADRPSHDAIVRTISHYDMVGWDLRKALAMLVHSHPTVLEWLQSPLVYFDRENFRDRLSATADQVVSLEACRFHYFRWARLNYDKLMEAPRASVKRCCLALRPLLAVLWLERGLGRPPTALRELAGRLVDWPPLQEAITAMLESSDSGKQAASERTRRVVSDYLTSELARLDGLRWGRPAVRRDLQSINAFFRAVVQQYDMATDEELDLSDWPAPPRSS
jgi:predicted nucleotidyltransferase